MATPVRWSICSELSADRDTSLQDLLNDTSRFLPERVVDVLVGEAFSRLDVTAQRVMQALAVYRYPVVPAAVDYLLQPYLPGMTGRAGARPPGGASSSRRDAGGTTCIRSIATMHWVE